MHEDRDHRSRQEFIAELDNRIVRTVDAAKAAIARLPPAEQARAALDLAALLLDGLDQLREAIAEAKGKVLDS